MKAFLAERWPALVAAVLLAVIVIQNLLSGDTATVLLLWAQLRVPTWGLVASVFLVGALFGGTLVHRRRRRET